jgi:hypothetical protein
MKYQKIAIWRTFLPKKNCFSYLPPLYPPACTHRAHQCRDDAHAAAPLCRPWCFTFSSARAHPVPMPELPTTLGWTLRRTSAPEPCHATRQSYFDTGSWRWTSSNGALASTHIPSGPPINLSPLPSLLRPPSPFIWSTARRDSESAR